MTGLNEVSPTEAGDARKLNVEHALDYANRGWAVIPIHTPDRQGACSCRKADCKSVGKHPRTMNGYKDGTTDAEQISKWWEMWPEANIGIVTGAESRIVALDVDPRSGGDISLGILQEDNGELPETFRTNTGGGGQHYLFEYPSGGVVLFPKGIGEGLDIQADKRYFVAPPSLHKSGKRYEQALDVPPVPMPDWLVEMMTPSQPGEGAVGTGATADVDLSTWERLNAEARRRILTRPEVTFSTDGQWASAKGVCHDGQGDSGIFVNLASNAYGCRKGCTVKEILRALGLPDGPLGADVQTPTNTFVDLGALLDAEVPPVVEVMSRIEKGTLVQFCAPTNVGKTTLLLNACIALAAGQAFPPLVPEASSPKKVMYVDFETGRSKFHQSVTKMLSRSPYNSPEVRDLVRRNILPLVDLEIEDYFLNMSEEGHLAYVQEQAHEFGAELIVIDNTSAGFELESDNNNSEVAKKVMMPLKRVAKKTETAVILVHHTAKPGEGARSGVDVYMGRGASNFANLCRSGYALVPAEQLGEGYVVLHNTKNKSGIKGEPVKMRLNFETLWFEVVGGTVTQDLTAEMVKDFVKRRGEATAGQIQDHFQSLGFSETTIRRRTNEARDLKLITRKNQRAPYIGVEDAGAVVSQAA